VALSVATTDHAAAVVTGAGLGVELAQMGPQALMAAARTPGVVFAADDGGGFIVPSFLPSFDATMAFAWLLDLLAQSGLRLSEVVAGLAEVHLAHDTVVTPWDLKGQVMRTLVERSKDHEVELVDGVKVRHSDGWALALPDPDEPVTHVWAEAESADGAERLVAEYVRRISQMVR